jgi:hypothetical protein
MAIIPPSQAMDVALQAHEMDGWTLVDGEEQHH